MKLGDPLRFTKHCNVEGEACCQAVAAAPWRAPARAEAGRTGGTFSALPDLMIGSTRPKRKPHSHCYDTVAGGRFGALATMRKGYAL